MTIDKRALVEWVLQKLEEERDVLKEAALATYQSATHEEAVAENRYDTRGLEASYLAGAQAKRVEELEEALSFFRQLNIRSFGEHDPIGLSALVTLEDEDEQRHYFLSPQAGGMKVEFGGKVIVLLTPHAPLGQRLLGAKMGDVIEVQSPSGVLELEILALS